MKFIIRSIVAAAALAVAAPLTVVATATPAAAAGGCVTKAEFRRVHKNDSLSTVRRKVGQRGVIASSSSFSDGDAWMDVKFRQCGRTWFWSSINVTFELTEWEMWQEDWYCDDYSGCTDYGYYVTEYRYPFRATSKYAYWF